jgi:hypothetical protein
MPELIKSGGEMTNTRVELTNRIGNSIGTEGYNFQQNLGFLITADNVLLTPIVRYKFLNTKSKTSGRAAKKVHLIVFLFKFE